MRGGIFRVIIYLSVCIKIKDGKVAPQRTAVTATTAGFYRILWCPASEVPPALGLQRRIGPGFLHDVYTIVNEMAVPPVMYSQCSLIVSSPLRWLQGRLTAGLPFESLLALYACRSLKLSFQLRSPWVQS